MSLEATLQMLGMIIPPIADNQFSIHHLLFSFIELKGNPYAPDRHYHPSNRL